MKFSLFGESVTQKVINLFESVFEASEGEEEGRIISNFVSNLITTTKQQDLIGCIAEDEETIYGCLFFSRLTVPSGQEAFILSPVAVSTDVQRKCIGQKLIHYGLDHLRDQKVDLVFTYGDPSYYSKTGFEKIDETTVRAPYPLSQPIGWLAQSLDGEKIQAMTGPTGCVEALNNPDLW